MEDYYYLWKTLLFSSVLLILYSVLKLVHSIWWGPICLEKYFRQQGIRGTSYKPLHGDREDIKRSSTEAWSKPMTLNHRIAPRVIPFFYYMVQTYGKQQ